MYLRQITIQDKSDIKSIYFDSINSIDEKIYSKQQKFAWSCQAWENREFDNAIIRGKGWAIEENSDLKGFAIRYPSNKLSLLYCRCNSKRKGFGSILLKRIEEDAKNENILYLKTEASLISYKLLLKNNWIIIRKEKVIIKNSIFNRYKMMKILI
tara:strand:+ start:8602 stop:9066 length:465 start_codon:yes stop_codon:yes gene_type:complete